MTDSASPLLPASGDQPAQESRRDFFKQFSTLAALSVVEPLQAMQTIETPPVPAPPLPGDPAPRLVPVQLRINGQPIRRTVDTRTTLLDLLREQLGLTGTKKGCNHGACGACTIHLNGRNVNSCLALAVMHQHQDIVTIEGLGTPEQLHPMQAAFIEHDGFQCGYCTSGQIMSAVAVAREGHARTEADIRELMSGNLCRCGAYNGIVAAIEQLMQQPENVPYAAKP